MREAASPRPSAVLIAGPTGSGKSALALDLARAIGGVIVNADSMQVYRELRILTARPTRREEAEVPHRLYGVVSAAEPWSVGRWLDAAAEEIAAAAAAGRLAIIVGGTGLYFESLTKGLAPVPPVPRELRDKWRSVLAEQGLEPLRSHLERLDPTMAARIPSSDRQRTLRALEVIEATGRSLARWHENASGDPPVGADALRIVLAPPRERLYRRIDDRARVMVDDGALDEVKALLGLDLDPTLPAMKAHGVRELASYLAGEASLETALSATRQTTRRYAKRQLTWARGRMASWRWVSSHEEGMAVAAALLR